ncbi:MAG: AAA family ATPase [Acidobacteria bacterium]|nr:AAA family ATPase [Acidobacteriota bacterium]
MNPFQENVRAYIRAGYPILYVVSAEEERAIELTGQAIAEGDLARRKLYIWSVSRGLCGTDMKPLDPRTADPKRILPYLLDFKQPGVFVLEDFHFFLDDRYPAAALAIRQLRDIVVPFQASRKSLVLLSPVLKIPPELEKDITVLDLEMPTEEELAAVLDETAEQMKDNPRVEVNLEGDARERIVKALSGLTRVEAENALAKVIVTRSRLDPEDVDLLLAEKEQIIRKSGMLEFYSSPERFGSIGGLDQLKQWLRQRGKAFSEAARAFGLPSPRGLLLAGVPGCGKSLTAKAVAAEWRMPLLKFDLGKVFAGLVGASEENMRRALKMAEAVAPCILWIDEIEKGLAGSRGSQGDSGVSSRVFGTLLTWMEENQRQVFVVATANDIEGLPSELLRKGRFDEIFFVDLPTPQERATILAIHLTRHHRDYRDFDLARHAAATEGFSGAELEQAVISALYAAFAEGEDTRLEDRHLEKAIGETVPLSQSMGERITRMREEARKRWRLASTPPVEGEEGGAEVEMAEPPPVPKKPRRVFEV